MIQINEREKFQAEMQAAGLAGHIENPYQSLSQQNYSQQHGTNNNNNKNKQNNRNNSDQQSSKRKTGNKRSLNSKSHSRRKTSAGGGPGGDSSDDGDEDKNNKDNINDKSDDSDSESQDSDVETGANITNKGNTDLQQLQKQNDDLKKQLANSNNRIDDLLNQISNGNAKNSNDKNKGTVPPNICELNIYKEMIKQQQLQMNKLMRCVTNVIPYIYSNIFAKT